MKQIVDGKLYNTKTARLVASDRYWDGSSYQRHGRNSYLYKTRKGNFFLHHTTLWQGERDHIEPVTREEAQWHYEQLPEQEIEYEDAFGEAPEEA